jgi:hypothetical protein
VIRLACICILPRFGHAGTQQNRLDQSLPQNAGMNKFCFSLSAVAVLCPMICGLHTIGKRDWFLGHRYELRRAPQSTSDDIYQAKMPPARIGRVQASSLSYAGVRKAELEQHLAMCSCEFGFQLCNFARGANNVQ